MKLHCLKCGGEGRLYQSKYGVNDPDVWDAGKCDACEADALRASAGPPAKAWDDIRGIRSIRLQQCDWTQTTDAPLDAPTKAAWGVYRQALRDLPEMAEGGGGGQHL